MEVAKYKLKLSTNVPIYLMVGRKVSGVCS